MNAVRSSLLTSILFGFALAAKPSACRAQATPLGFLDKVFGNVTDITGSVLLGSPIANRGTVAGSLTGLAVEVILGLGSMGKSACPVGDTSLTELRIQAGLHGNDTTRVYAVAAKRPPKDCVPRPPFSAELGLGYGRLSGFRNEALNLQGTVEELPVAAFYVTYDKGDLKPYAGVHAGLASLRDFRAIVSDVVYRASGSTFEYGLNLGIAWSLVRPWVVFAEVAWTYRSFDGVDWAGLPPQALQAPLRLSSRTIAIGGQVEFGPASKAAGATGTSP